MTAIAPAVAGEIVKTASGTSIANASWTIVGLIITGFTAVAVAIIKQWGPWKKAATDARADDIERLRDDIKRMEDKHDKLEREVRESRETAHRAQMQTAMLSAALSLVSAELERQDPGNAIIKEARDMVARAACADVGFGDDLRRLAQFKGVGE